MRNGSKAVAVFAALAALGVASPAAAGPGNGVRLGGSEGRVHPFLELETRYDSNVYYNDARQGLGDGILHVRPGLDLTVPGELTALDLRAALDWAQYLGMKPGTSDLSRLYGEATLGVGVNRRGELGLELTDGFRRTTNTSALSLGSAVIANSNAFRAAVPWKPGGGALILTAGGEWQLETYEPYLSGTVCDPASGLTQCDVSKLSKLGWNEVRGTGELRWKFLPRTAYVLDGGYFKRIPNDRTLSTDVSGFRTTTGLAGLVTPHLAGTLKAGYGQTFGDVDVRTWLANVEAEWIATETSGARLGYVHDVGADPGLTFSVYQSHRVYADAHLLVASRFTARLGGSFERRAYERVSASTTLVRVEPAIDADVTRWLKLSAGYAYTDRTSDLPAGTPALPGFVYSKHEVWLRSNLMY